MSDADVIASDILKDKIAYKEDENGNVIKIQGSIETINPSIKDDENGLYFNVPKGYVNSEYN
jgi:hypothetical protein